MSTNQLSLKQERPNRFYPEAEAVMGIARSGQHRRGLSTYSAPGQSHCCFHDCHHHPQMDSLLIPLSVSCVHIGASTCLPGKKPLGNSRSTQSIAADTLLGSRHAGTRVRDKDQSF